MVKHDAAPVPPANSFLGAFRGDVMRRHLAPYLMALVLLLFSGFATTATAQTTAEYNTIVETTVAPDEEDTQRVRRFAKMVPPAFRAWLPDVRQGGHHRTPVLSFRHWMVERKPLPATFLFCMFIGLLGTAFFPKQISVAAECCRTQFWRCLGRATLSGIVVLITIIILDRLVITESLATVLIALMQFVLVAGLSVGVSMLGDRVLERTKITNIEYLKTHPRVATFLKLLIGSLLIALIVQLPGLGKLPRIGIRIAVLIAILGAGGLLKTRFGTQPVSSD